MTELEITEQPGTGSPGPFPAIPIRAEGQDLSGGHQGVHVTFQMMSAENPVVQLLGRDYSRLEARILAYAAGSAPNNGITLDAQGQATAPASGQSIATLTDPPAGTYQVSVIVYIDGTPVTATDDDNFKLIIIGGSTVGHLLCPAQSSGVPVLASSGPYTMTVTGSQNIAIQAAAAASADAVYHAQIIATPVTGSAPAGIVLAQSKEIAEFAATQGAAFTGPGGSFLPIGVDRTLRNCDEVWAAALTPAPVLVSAIVSRRLAVANHPGL
jgi:hypothetical protein